MNYDVIISGSGPAGSTAALALAQLGRRVLLVDQHQFPRDKSCGDFIPAKAVEVLIQLGLEEKVQISCREKHFNLLSSQRLYTPNNKIFEFKLKYNNDLVQNYISPRVYFDQLIQKSAMEAGVDFFCGKVVAPILDNHYVVGLEIQSKQETKFAKGKIIIAADGATSVLRRSLQNSFDDFKDHHKAVALRAYLQGVDINFDQAELYFEKIFMPGYAWIFPMHNDKVNIGIGMRLDHLKRKKTQLIPLLKQFMNLPYIKNRLSKNYKLENISSWILPLGSQKNIKVVDHGIIFIGDAAGLVDPITGGGIDNAVVSGQIAAKVVHQALIKNDFSHSQLLEYQHYCDNSFYKPMRNKYIKQVLLTKFPILMDIIGLGDGWKLIK